MLPVVTPLSPGHQQARQHCWICAVFGSILATLVLVLLIEAIVLYFCRHIHSCDEGYQYTERCGNWEQDPVCCRQIMGGCSCSDSRALIYTQCSSESMILQVMKWTGLSFASALFFCVLSFFFSFLFSSH